MKKRGRGSYCSLALAITLSTSLAGCTPVPKKPHSPYFAKLLALAGPNDIKPYDLYEPHTANNESSAIGDLLLDGFEPQISTDALTSILEQIECEGIPFTKTTLWGNNRVTFHLSFIWKSSEILSSLFPRFGISIYVDKNCSIIEVIGGRYSII